MGGRFSNVGKGEIYLKIQGHAHTTSREEAESNIILKQVGDSSMVLEWKEEI